MTVDPGAQFAGGFGKIALGSGPEQGAPVPDGEVKGKSQRQNQDEQFVHLPHPCKLLQRNARLFGHFPQSIGQGDGQPRAHDGWQIADHGKLR